jgi:hypothetical protein
MADLHHRDQRSGQTSCLLTKQLESFVENCGTFSPFRLFFPLSEKKPQKMLMNVLRSDE